MDDLPCRHPVDAVRSDIDRILKKRNTLLKQAGGLKQAGAQAGRWEAPTEVTDLGCGTRTAEAGEALGRARAGLVTALGAREQGVRGHRERPVDPAV
jgi:hypothetical protein